MTDAEINLAIANIEYPDHKIKPWIDSVTVTPVGHPSIRGIDYMEWCWIGPIIEREKIKLTSSEGFDWKATMVKPRDELTYGVWSEHAETPTRAAALCFVSYLYSK